MTVDELLREDPDDMLTVAQVAKRLNVKPQRVYDAVARKQLRGRKIGGLLRFLPEDVRAFIERSATDR